MFSPSHRICISNAGEAMRCLTRWIFLLQIAVLISFEDLFVLIGHHTLNSCHISSQTQSSLFVIFSIPFHYTSTDEGSSCNRNKYNQHIHIFHDTLRSSAINKPCGNKSFYDAFIQGSSFPKSGEYLTCFLCRTLCN